MRIEELFFHSWNGENDCCKCGIKIKKHEYHLDTDINYILCDSCVTILFEKIETVIKDFIKNDPTITNDGCVSKLLEGFFGKSKI